MTSYCQKNHRTMISNLLLKSGILFLIGLHFFSETVGANSEDNGKYDFFLFVFHTYGVGRF